jgi:hypothetical protein
MAFNKQDYISQTNKSPTQRLIDQAASVPISGRKTNVTNSITDIAKQLLLIGTSLDNTAFRLGSQAVALTSGSEELYFALAGLDVSRTQGKSLSQIRRVNNQTASEYFRDTNPATRIQRKRRQANIELLSAI